MPTAPEEGGTCLTSALLSSPSGFFVWFSPPTFFSLLGVHFFLRSEFPTKSSGAVSVLQTNVFLSFIFFRVFLSPKFFFPPSAERFLLVDWLPENGGLILATSDGGRVFISLSPYQRCFFRLVL